MNRNDRTSSYILSSLAKVLLITLMTGLLSGVQPILAARGMLATAGNLGVFTSGERVGPIAGVENQISGETVVIEPAGSATWQEMLDAEAQNPPVTGIPSVVPYMPMPGPHELLGPQGHSVNGETMTAAPAGTVEWQEMVNDEATHPLEPGTPQVAPFMPMPTPRELSAVDNGATSFAAGPLAPPGTVHSFLGLDDNNTSIPPDTMGAAGPDHLLVMLNTQVRIQSKTGTTLNTVSLSTFWTSGTGLSGSPFDPKVVYDSLSGRWLATVDANAQSTTSAVWFAISATSDPTGSWTFYAFDADAANTYWADYPGFGMNSTWIAITNNMFTMAGAFGGAKMWVIDKSSALTGGPLTTTVFAMGFDTAGGYSGFTLKPAETFDAAETTLYIMDGNRYAIGGVGLLRLSRITGSGASPSWAVVPNDSTGYVGTGWFLTPATYNVTQIDADQLGTTTDVETNDPRILNTVFRNGRLWATHSGGYPRTSTANRTVAVWYEIDPAVSSAPVVQSGVVDSGAGTHHFFPSISVNANNAVALGFSYSDATQYVEAAYTGRESSDPAGTMGAVTTCKAGESSYSKFFSGTRNRWGDYSATVVDPVDDLTFWTLQEYAGTNVGPGVNDGRWGTWWCRAQVGNFWQGDDATNPTLWNVAANWSSNTVPTCATDAVIPTTPIGGVFPTVNVDANVRNLTIAVGATINMSGNTLTVCGNWDNSGTFNSTGGTVNFNGGTTQNVTANTATAFTNLTVSSGTTLVETVTADNATVNGTLTNNGRIRKAKFGLAAGSTNFGLTRAAINITTLGDLRTLQVDRVGSAHPNEDSNGGGADMLNTYYALTPDATNQSFTLNLCLSYTDAELAAALAVSNEANLRLCRWTGSEWNCPARSGSSSTANNTVCAAGVNTLSDWTIGETGPTAVTMESVNSRADARGSRDALLVILAVLTGGGLALVWGVRRVTGPKAR